MSDAQMWTIIGTVFAVPLALIGFFGVWAKAYLDAKFDNLGTRFESIDSKFDAVGYRFDAVDAKFDAIRTQITHLDRDVEALAKRVMEGPA